MKKWHGSLFYGNPGKQKAVYMERGGKAAHTKDSFAGPGGGAMPESWYRICSLCNQIRFIG